MIANGEALVVEDVRKVYGDVVANDGISLTVQPGEVYGLLGPNGAGKTTLVSQIIGLRTPTSGSIRLGPIDLVAQPDAARKLCSYLPQAQMPIGRCGRARRSRCWGGSGAATRRRCAGGRISCWTSLNCASGRDVRQQALGRREAPDRLRHGHGAAGAAGDPGRTDERR